MKRAFVLLCGLGLLVAACRDFDVARDQCVDAGRCSSSSGGGATGGGVSTGGGGLSTGGGSTGGGGGGGGVSTGGGGSVSTGGGGGVSTGGGNGCAGLYVFGQRHYITDAQPDSPANELGPVEADYRDGGGYSVVPGNSLGGGAFCISNAPAGPLYVRVGSSMWFYTSARSLDVSQWFLGRADIVDAQSSSSLHYSNNLNLVPAWRSDDRFRLFSFGAHLASRPLTFDAGVSQITSATFSLASSYAYSPTLVKSNEGDIVYLARYADAGAPDVLIQYVAGTANASQNAQADVAAGDFVTVPLNETIQLNWKAPATANQVANDVFPYQTLTAGSDIEIAPNIGDAGLSGSTIGPLVEIDGQPFNGTITYGNPFGGPELIVGELEFSTLWRAPDAGSSNQAKIHAYVGMSVVADAGVATVDVDLTPPRALTFNDAGLPVSTGTTVTPPITVGWTRPSVGTPSSYQLSIWSITVSGGTSYANVVDSIYLPDGNATSVPLPPLASGAYVVIVTSVYVPGYDPQVPLRPNEVNFGADAVSGIIVLP